MIYEANNGYEEMLFKCKYEQFEIGQVGDEHISSWLWNMDIPSSYATPTWLCFLEYHDVLGLVQGSLMQQ
jgi:hypothetical protein